MSESNRYIYSTHSHAQNNSPFELSTFFVMAGEDNTELSLNGVKINGAGPNGVMQKGESLSFNVIEGDLVTADRPVQVDFLAGQITSNYQLRWYAQVRTVVLLCLCDCFAVVLLYALVCDGRF
jgi:hypothetical protein